MAAQNPESEGCKILLWFCLFQKDQNDKLIEYLVVVILHGPYP